MRTQEKKRVYTGFEEMADEINKEESGMTENVEKKTTATTAKKVKPAAAPKKDEPEKKSAIKRFGGWINRNKWWIIGTVGSAGIGYGLGRIHQKYSSAKEVPAGTEPLALPEAEETLDVPEIEVPSIEVPGLD